MASPESGWLRRPPTNAARKDRVAVTHRWSARPIVLAMILAVSDLVGMLIALPAAFVALFVGFRLVAAISAEQGRKGIDDRSNRVGRILVGVLGGLVGRDRH
jgi:uncharacterized membrane protein (DUF4010 family)